VIESYTVIVPRDPDPTNDHHDADQIFGVPKPAVAAALITVVGINIAQCFEFSLMLTSAKGPNLIYRLPGDNPHGPDQRQPTEQFRYNASQVTTSGASTAYATLVTTIAPMTST
jgi:hypothetical protein